MEEDPSSSSDNRTVEVLRGFKDINEFSQHTLRSVVMAVKSVNELPAVGDDYDYYTSFPGVRDILDIEGKRVLHVMQDIMRCLHVKGNLATSGDKSADLEDKFDVLMDANDQILERVGNWLDEASGVKKKEDTLLLAAATPKNSSNASWNKKSVSAGFSTVGNYKLLAARNIQRPQLKFKDKVDNRNQPFIPKITKKPNAIKSLEESLRLPEGVSPENLEDPDFLYPHPYQEELDLLQPTAHQLACNEAQLSCPLKDTPLTMVNTVEQLHCVITKLKEETEIAVDLEAHTYRSFQGFVCLMQLSTRTEDFLVDALDLRHELHVMNEVFTDPSIVKVLHGANSDIEWLQRDFGLYIVNMFDTGQASRVLGFNKFSLAYLLDHYCGVQADKQYQLADWRIRPLPEQLVNYAREDTHYLLFIYDVMKKELLERGNEQKNLVRSVLQRSTDICAKVYRKYVLKEEDYLELYKKSKKVFNSQQLVALQQLYAWRDRLARQEDESPAYVLPNHMLLQISEILPRERQGVFACCNPIPPLVRQFLPELHSYILKARETQLVKVKVHEKSQPSSYQHPKYDPTSLLNCCHDMTYQDIERVPDVNMIAKTSTLYGTNNSGMAVIMKEKALLSVFEDKTFRINTNAERIAAAIRASFVSPFTMYLPDDDEKFTGKSNFRSQRAPQVMETWKLCPNTVKRKARERSPDEFNDQDPPAKRQKVEIREAPSSEKLQTLKQIKAKHKKMTDTIDSISNAVKSEKKLKKDKELVKVTPFDYSKVDAQMFQGEKSMKKQNMYDPMSEMKKRGKGHKVNKPQTSTNKSQKNFTYHRKDNSSSSQRWSKKGQ